jgi:hypothetical protein
VPGFNPPSPVHTLPSKRKKRKENSIWFSNIVAIRELDILISTDPSIKIVKDLFTFPRTKKSFQI